MGTKISALRPDDRSWFHGFIHETVDLTRPRIDTTAANKLVLAALHEIEAHSPSIEEQVRARRTLNALAEDGSRNHVDSVIREARTAVLLPNKNIVAMPARVGVRRAGQNVWQQCLWYELTWDEFDGLLVRYESRHHTDGMKLFALRGVRSLRAQFPDTATVGDAVRLSGLDPQELDLAS